MLRSLWQSIYCHAVNTVMEALATIRRAYAAKPQDHRRTLASVRPRTDNEDQATTPPMPLSSKCSSYQSRCTVFIVVLSITQLLHSLGAIWSSRIRRLRCRRPSKTSYYSTGPLRLHSHRISRVPVEPAFAIRIVGRRAAREKPEKSPEF
jgi:hypothetical protein